MIISVTIAIAVCFFCYLCYDIATLMITRHCYNSYDIVAAPSPSLWVTSPCMRNACMLVFFTLIRVCFKWRQMPDHKQGKDCRWHTGRYIQYMHYPGIQATGRGWKHTHTNFIESSYSKTIFPNKVFVHFTSQKQHTKMKIIKEYENKATKNNTNERTNSKTRNRKIYKENKRLAYRPSKIYACFALVLLRVAIAHFFLSFSFISLYICWRGSFICAAVLSLSAAVAADEYTPYVLCTQ